MILSDWLWSDSCYVSVGGADVSRWWSASWSACLGLAGCYILGVLYVVQDEFCCHVRLWWVIWGLVCGGGDLVGLCGWDVWNW